ncbi:MAG: hypothetical protein J6V50_02435, partial [Clostridia bacterium]|nr:hypothetical protein [Clostridia bacterium]
VVEGEETDWLAFDKLGIETLVVDEAHNFKNIPLSTKADNIVGMHATGSVKCKEMAEKTKVVKKVIFATATPITNSLSDLFALQTYLQSEELKFRGIDAFDMWLNSFADKRTSFEVEPDGKRLRSITRFSKFHNLTELMMLFSTVCDFYYSDENNELLPKFDGYIKVCVEKCKAQTEYYNELSTRIDRVRSRKVTPTEDNLLKITVDGRSCAVHPQLVGDKYKVLPGEESKITKCAEKVIELYLEYPETCQLVFSDVGTPKSEFNVYDALKEELVKRGIRAAEIAYIHDATTEKARTRLFAAINSGKVRVVIGSTVKLGVGVNVQERLIAIHHLSVPWRPSDLTQRDGRLIRQGNTCEKVFIYCYVTTGTFDSYSWQLLETKQRFISNFLSATLASREADDVSDTVLNYAEIKALAVGNPLIKQRIETSNLLERVLSACRSRQNELTRLRVIVDSTPAKIKKLKLQLAVLKLDIKHYEKNRESVPKEERMAFGEELLYALSENSMQVSERYFEEYQGFKIYLPADMKAEEPYVIIRSANGGKYEVKMNTDKSLGCATRIDNKLVCLSDDAAKAEESIAVCERQREVAIADIEKGNKYLDEVQEVRKLLADIDRILEEEENIVA